MTGQTINSPWSLQRTIPLTLILGLVTQAAAIIWTSSQMASDISKNAEKIAVLELQFAKLEDSVQAQAVSMARIDENIGHIRQAVERMASSPPN